MVHGRAAGIVIAAAVSPDDPAVASIPSILIVIVIVIVGVVVSGVVSVFALTPPIRAVTAASPDAEYSIILTATAAATVIVIVIVIAIIVTIMVIIAGNVVQHAVIVSVNAFQILDCGSLVPGVGVIGVSFRGFRGQIPLTDSESRCLPPI